MLQIFLFLGFHKLSKFVKSYQFYHQMHQKVKDGWDEIEPDFLCKIHNFVRTQ